MSTKSAKKKSANRIPALISNNKLQQLYATMLRCRILDSHARSISRGHSWKGQEAALVGTAIDLQAEDAIVSSSATVAGFLKGLPLHSIFSHLHQQPTGRKAVTGAAAQGSLATGIAYAHSAENKGSITLALLSENPASSEAGHDALRLAGLNKLPILYVYSGPPVDALQGYAYGFPVIPVDASDVVAVYRVAYECMTRARQGGGPSVIACTYGDSAKRPDPLRSMEKFLSAKGLFTEERKQRTIRAFEEAIAKAKTASRKTSSRGKAVHTSERIFLM